ncbi:MAG: N-acetylmuramoyl-L-alanine amidase [Oligoflexia bacterium]|nr:N-acetylmuramoyl-L-alanine amidase [Oligoflexia bacterium]
MSVQATTILIDPGHGGDDLGAVSSFMEREKDTQKDNQNSKKLGRVYYIEKELALEFAKKIYKELEKKYSVYMTRSFDNTISLDERAQMAEKVKADLFLSIHMNSSAKSSSQGFEIYYLDNHNDVAVRKVENVENRRISGSGSGGDIVNDSAFTDPIVHKILIDLIVERTVISSRKLAFEIHDELKSKISYKYNFKDRKVLAGVFYVLALSKCPAVLLEVGFISNHNEAMKLKGENFQKEYAKAVASAIDRYLKIADSGKLGFVSNQ